MLFKIKEKFWSLGDTFTITDKQGHPKYLVKGKAFSWGNSLSFQDTQRHELASIRQKLLAWKQTYHIHVGGERYAEVTKEFSWLKKKFALDVPGPNDYFIDGSFWQHNFVFKRQGKMVAEVEKKAWGWKDSYGVNIVDGENEIAILCTCIVIDQILEDEQDRKDKEKEQET